MLVLCASAGAAHAQDVAADPATAGRLRAHQHTAASHTSIQADVITTTHNPRRRILGRVVLRGAYAYYRAAEDAHGDERTLQESVVTPTEQRTVNYEAGAATRVDLARLREVAPQASVPNNARDLLDVFGRAAPGTVQYLGPTAHGSDTLDRFRVTAVLGDEAAGELHVWIGPADGLPRRLELQSTGGRVLLVREYVNVKVNAPVPDGLFVLDIPDGIPVHDLTDEYVTRAGQPAAP